ncbi:hypothetical protein TDSAC_1341 [Thermodesulfobium acidiphilum]|uniref:Winged helix-turn-helix DNA-binding n=1 Tax=Thermodesulfobium acidiphilum TaxID=1794699 RepID=A0A2R4W1K3_THEAF|nr:hypothetical protein [Thermodesulfobium acidiphilum]AWB10681.1 hypothetical protein TDSAC_1341 [Thermodesulfobium acidiphilum]
MAADPSIKIKICEYLKTVKQAKNRQIAEKIGEDKKAVDAAIAELANEGIVEYIYVTTSFVVLKDEYHNDPNWHYTPK